MKMQLIHPAAQNRPPLTEAALCAWVGQAGPGDQLVYHRGFLAIDIGPDSKAFMPARRRELRALADRAWKLAKEGSVHLVQQREGDGSFSYIVVVRHRHRRRSGAFQAVLLADELGEIGSQPITPPTRTLA
jgi:hypothetical protein